MKNALALLATFFAFTGSALGVNPIKYTPITTNEWVGASNVIRSVASTVVPAGGVTNNQGNVNLAGTFVGNGVGLTNILSSAIVGGAGSTATNVSITATTTNVLTVSGLTSSWVSWLGFSAGTNINATAGNGTYYYSNSTGSYIGPSGYGIATNSAVQSILMTNGSLNDVDAGNIVAAISSSGPSTPYQGSLHDGNDSGSAGAVSAYGSIGILAFSGQDPVSLGASVPISYVGDGGGLTGVPSATNANNATASGLATNLQWGYNLPLPDFATRGHDEPRWFIDLPEGNSGSSSYYLNLTNTLAGSAIGGQTNRGTTMFHVDDWWQGTLTNGIIPPRAGDFPNGMKGFADTCHTNGCLFDIYLKDTDLYGLGKDFADASTIVSNLVWCGADGLEIDTSFTFGDSPPSQARYGIYYKLGRLSAMVRQVNRGISLAWREGTNGTPRPFVVWGGLARTIDWNDAGFQDMVIEFNPEAFDAFGMFILNWDQNGAPIDYVRTMKAWVFPYRDFIKKGHYLLGWPLSDSQLGTDEEGWRKWFSFNALVPNSVFVRTTQLADANVAAAYTNMEWWTYSYDRAYICGSAVWSNNLNEVWVKPIGGKPSSTNLVNLVNMNSGASNVVLTAALLGVSSNLVMQVRDPWYHTNGPIFTNGISISVPASNVWTYAVYPASGPVSVSLGASPSLWTNTLGFAVTATIGGTTAGTVTGIGINGVQDSGSTVPWRVSLLPGDWVGITNSSVPSFTWKRSQ